MEEELNWDEFISLIRGKQLIPVIGTDLLQMKQGDTPLYDLITHKLAEKLKKPIEDLPLMEFVEKYQDESMGGIKSIVKSIYKEIEIDELNLTPLEQLAKITDFEFYISTSFDDFFNQILQRERSKKNEEIEEINYSLARYDAEANPDLESSVTLFNLLGNINKRSDFAITDEEILEYIYSIRDQIEYIPQLLDALEDKNLLFLGCSFPNWLLRFIIRIISNERFKDQHIGKIIADNETYNDPKLSGFLKHFKTTIVPIPNAQFANTHDFVQQLYEKWSKVSLAKMEERYQGTVFLSYSHEDKEKIEKVFVALKMRGVDVWWDEDKLESGAIYKDRINDVIIKCTLFISFISENAIEDTESYVYAKEWRDAESRRMFTKDMAFIKPFVIDDTDFSDPRIPSIFRDVTIKPLKDIDDFVEEITSYLIKL